MSCHGVLVGTICLSDSPGLLCTTQTYRPQRTGPVPSQRPQAHMGCIVPPPQDPHHRPGQSLTLSRESAWPGATPWRIRVSPDQDRRWPWVASQGCPGLRVGGQSLSARPEGGRHRAATIMCPYFAFKLSFGMIIDSEEAAEQSCPVQPSTTGVSFGLLGPGGSSLEDGL